MAADDNSVGICKKALKVSLYELFYCCECTIKPPMNLAFKLINNDLSCIEISQPIPPPLSTPHGNQDHPVIVSNKRLGMGGVIMEKVDAFRSFPIFLLDI